MLFLRIFLIGFIALATYLVLDVSYTSAQVKEIAVSPIPEEAIKSDGVNTEISTTSETFDEDLGKAVEEALVDSKGTYAVVIKDLKTGATYARDPDHVFATASLYKLWVMGETYHQIAEGEFTEETKLSNTVESLNKTFGISSDSAELKEGGFTMTVKEALTKMITISHNYAAYMLTVKIKSANMKEFIESHGFAHSKIGPDPESTAADMALFLEKLYKGELGTSDNTGKMMGLLAGQEINDRIPKYLPKNVRVMHKTGELGGVKHDVGIVQGPAGDYIIVLMSDTNNPQAAAERLANLSKNVYEYMEKHKQ